MAAGERAAVGVRARERGQLVRRGAGLEPGARGSRAAQVVRPELSRAGSGCASRRPARPAGPPRPRTTRSSPRSVPRVDRTSHVAVQRAPSSSRPSSRSPSRRIRSTVGRSSRRGGLSRISRDSAVKNSRAPIRSTCRRGGVRLAAGATRVAGRAARRAASRPKPSWTACAAAQAPSPSTCVSPGELTHPRRGGDRRARPSGGGAAGRRRAGDRVDAAVGARRARANGREHVRPQVDQRQDVEAAVRLGHREQHRSAAEVEPGRAAQRVGVGRPARGGRQLARVHEPVHRCAHRNRVRARPRAVIRARTRSMSTSG